MRRLVFWLHLALGVISALVILLMAATGALLTYERQLVSWADRTVAARPPTPGAVRLDADALVAAAVAANPGPVVALTVSSAPDTPALVTVGARIIAMNAYTGAVLGDASPRLRQLFRTVTEVHRYLGATAGPARDATRAVTGWSTVAFLLIIAGGLYLWLPRRLDWPRIRAIALFRPGLRGKARDFNWHHVVGIWTAVPLLVIAATALPMSFAWANAALYGVVGEEAPARGRARSDAARVDHAQPPAGLTAFIAVAERHVPDWKTITLRLGDGPGPVALSIDRGTGGQPQLRGSLAVDRTSARIVRWETFESQSPGRRLRTFARFAHTGEYFGLIGQTAAGLACVGASVLVVTGLALTVRRASAWASRRPMSAARARRYASAPISNLSSGG